MVMQHLYAKLEIGSPKQTIYVPLEIEKNDFLGRLFPKKIVSLFIQFPINEQGTYPIYEPFKITVYIIKFI